MNFFETEIAKLENRLKRIQENPDHAKLMVNVQLYSMELDLRKKQLQAWKEGRPFAFAPAIMAPFVRSLGFEYLDLHHMADRVTGKVDEYEQCIQSHGYPLTACDRTVISVAMVLMGDVPQPSFVISANTACEPLILACNAIAYEFDIPASFVDIPQTVDKPSEELLQYTTKQLSEVINHAGESVPSKFDENRLRELQEWDRRALGHLHEIYELRARIPCPMKSQDVFRLPRLPSFYPDPSQVVDYFGGFRYEVNKRVEKVMGPLRDEKLRVLWTVSAPYGRDIFRVLEERGASMTHFQFGTAARQFGARYGVYGDEREYGRKLSPLEEQSRIMLFNSWAGLGRRWIEDTLQICRDLHIGAIINFEQKGCVAASGLRKLLQDAAERELKIPTLHIEGRNLMANETERMHFEEKLGLFVEIAIESSQSNRCQNCDGVKW